MKFLILLLVTHLCFTTVFGASLVPKSQHNTRIIGGKTARTGQFPWQAAVYIDTVNGKFFCGGALISASWVLTAGHCVYGVRVWTIQLGSNTLQTGDPNRVILATSTGIVYPLFNATTLKDDIVLIKFHMPVIFTDYIKPIELALSGTIVDNLLVEAAGWGQIDDETPGIVNSLQWTEMTVISNIECELTYQDQIKSNMFCAVGNFNEGICVGDTGSALITLDSEGNPLLVGTASFFSGNGCNTAEPSGYVRTDLYYPWINEVTGL